MKIISTKEYNKLKKTQSAYLDLLMKPLQGVFEKVTDDDLLRENGLLNAENERLNNDIKVLLKENENKEKVIIAQDNIIKEVREYMERYMFSQKENYDYIHLLDILKGSDKE